MKNIFLVRLALKQEPKLYSDIFIKFPTIVKIMGATLEYCIFNVRNPFETEDALENSYSDTYLVLGDNFSLKIRDGNQVKYKRLLQRKNGIDYFLNQSFENDPEKDPLRSFLKVHKFDITAPGILVEKKRKLYRKGNVQVYFCEFDIGVQQHTALTLVGRNADALIKKRDELQLSEKNINFCEYLKTHVPKT